MLGSRTSEGGGPMAFSDKQAALRYINEYQKQNYDRITVMAERGKKAQYQAAAKKQGLSLSAFVMQCVDAKIEEMKEQE